MAPISDAALRKLRHIYNAAYSAYQGCLLALNEAATLGKPASPELLVNEAAALHALTDSGESFRRDGKANRRLPFGLTLVRRAGTAFASMNQQLGSAQILRRHGGIIMASDALEAARSRYTAAYAAYARAAKRVAKMLADGLSPSAELISDEAKATENLATARREFLDLINARRATAAIAGLAKHPGVQI